MVMFRQYVMIAIRDGRVPPLYLYFVMITIGFSYIYSETKIFDIVFFLVAFISYAFLLASINFFDDYFDYKNGLDQPDSPNTIYRRHPVFYYNIESDMLLAGGIVCSVVSFAIILLFSFITHVYGFIIFGALGIIVAYGYTGPPFEFKYRGLGETVLMVSFIVIFISIYYYEIRILTLHYIVLAFPFSLFLFVLLYIGNLRDMKYDRGKIKTVPVLLGRERSLALMKVLTAIALAMTCLYAIVGLSKMISLIALLTLPVFIMFFHKFEKISSSDLENRYGQIISLYGLLIILSLLI